MLRLDLPGIGDSAEGAEPARRHLYSDAAMPGVQAALSHLGDCHGLDRFVLVGLCSGAYAAYRTAAEDPRVVAQVLINPQTLEWKPGNSLEVLMRQSYRPSHSYLTLLGEPDAWKRLLRQQVDVQGICEALGSRLAARGAVALRSSLPSAATGSLRDRRGPELPPDRGARGRHAAGLRRRRSRAWRRRCCTWGRARGASAGGTACGWRSSKARITSSRRRRAREVMLSAIVGHLARRYPEAPAGA